MTLVCWSFLSRARRGLCMHCASPAVGVLRRRSQQAAVLSQMAQVYCFHEIYNTGVFTPVTAVTHYGWIRRCSLRGEHGSVTTQLCAKAGSPPCCLAELGRLFLAFPTQQLAIMHQEKEFHFALFAS